MTTRSSKNKGRAPQASHWGGDESLAFPTCGWLLCCGCALTASRIARSMVHPSPFCLVHDPTDLSAFISRAVCFRNTHAHSFQHSLSWPWRLCDLSSWKTPWSNNTSCGSQWIWGISLISQTGSNHSPEVLQMGPRSGNMVKLSDDSWKTSHLFYFYYTSSTW